MNLVAADTHNFKGMLVLSQDYNRPMASHRVTRREFLRDAAAISAVAGTSRFASTTSWTYAPPLQTFDYGAITLHSPLHVAQFENCRDVLMGLNEDSLMKPFRQMAGVAAPGEDLGGWYNYKADYDYRKDDAGFAPAATFGQWVSALARMYSASGDARLRSKVLRLNQLYAKAVSGDFFDKTRFPAYTYDKLVCGLIDAHQFANDPDAFNILQLTTKTAMPHLPKRAIPNRQNWRPGKDISWDWDESYTLPENLFLAYERGAGHDYLSRAVMFLADDDYFDPLAEGRDILAGRHAYSHMNALCSAMKAFEALRSEKYLLAAKNGFDMVAAQSFATGGWGPDEQLRAPGSDDVAESLTKTHNSFETPCGAYAHFKLTRYLLAATRDSRYGDSMERVMYNTVLGAKPLKADGSTFYYSDYNFSAHKVYSNHIWPCCSGTHPQVAADYGINSYFRDGQYIYVNLYIPSTLKWKAGDSNVELTQRGDYPFEGGRVEFELKMDRSANFTLLLRIPEWAHDGSLAINGKRDTKPWMPGNFAVAGNKWKNGDRVTLEFAMENRLEAISAKHPETVALVRGPLAMFAIGSEIPAVRREQLLAAKRSSSDSWKVQTDKSAVTLMPFTSIQDQEYSLYLRSS